MTYYAQRKIVTNGTPQATVTNKVGTREEMEYQYCLFRASACKNSPNDMDVVEWGTFENGIIERMVYAKETQPEEPTE